MSSFDRMDLVLTAIWSRAEGVDVTSTELPTEWSTALHRLGRDLRVRQYNGDVERIAWQAQHWLEFDLVMLNSSVALAGGEGVGFGGSGSGAGVYASEDEVLVSIADRVQDEIADCGVAWPWGDRGGFMDAVLVDGVAMWRDRDGRLTRVGELLEIAR